MAKKPVPSFSILFKGSGVYPEDIPWQKVFDVLKAVHQLARAGEPEEDDGESLRLIGVARGSAVFQCYARDTERTLKNLRLTGEMLTTGDLPADAVLRARPLEELSRIARSLSCDILIRRDRDEILAKIQGDTYSELFGSQMVSGETTIIGVVKRVGGATERRCTLKIPSRHDLLYCDVSSDEVARDLGRHLYDEIVLTGMAKWLKTDWGIVGFRVDSIAPTRDCSFAQAFRRLRAAGGDAWDSVHDPDKLLRKIRG